MRRKNFIKLLSLLPVSGNAFASLPSESLSHHQNKPDAFINTDNRELPKRLAAIVTVFRKNSHAEVTIGKYLEGYNRDNRPPYPKSKVVSIFTEQVPENDTSRYLADKYNVPIYPTVMDALTLGGDEIAVDGVILIGEHGEYRMNKKQQKLYPRYEMFLKITDAFRKFHKSVPVFNDKHLSWNWRQAKRIVEISRELNFPMLAGSSVPVAYRQPAVDVPFGVKQKHAVALAFSWLDVYGFHLLEALQCITERRQGGETGVKSVQCLEGKECWKFIKETQWVNRLFNEALSRSNTRAEGDMMKLVKEPFPYVFIINYNDGLQAAAISMMGLVRDFTVAVDLEGQDKPFSVLMDLQGGMPYHHFSCLVKNMEEMFQTGIPPYPVERTMLTSGILDFALESRIRDHEELPTPELAKVRYFTPDSSHFCKKGWGPDGKMIE